MISEEKQFYLVKSFGRYMMYAFAEFFLIVAGAIVAIKISNNTDKWYVILALMGVVFGAALVKFIADELKNLKDEP